MIMRKLLKEYSWRHRILNGAQRNRCVGLSACDVTGSDDLLAKVEACGPSRVNQFGSYSYGFMSLRNLDWISFVLARVSQN